MSTFSNFFRAETFDRNVMSFFLRRNAEISGNFPGNLLAGCGNSFRKLSSSTPEILTYPKKGHGEDAVPAAKTRRRAAGDERRAASGEAPAPMRDETQYARNMA